MIAEDDGETTYQPRGGGLRLWQTNAGGAGALAMYINHTNFTNNYAGDGGGGVGLVTHFEWSIRNCVFEGNRAEKEGGGIYLTDDKTENFKVKTINQINILV